MLHCRIIKSICGVVDRSLHDAALKSNAWNSVESIEKAEIRTVDVQCDS